MENLALVEDIFRVGVLAPVDWIRSLQLEINKKAIKKIELFQVRVSEVPNKIDALICFIEHGAQVPSQFLKNFPEMQKIAVLETPLPLQYVQLSQAGWWRFVSWENGRFDKAALALIELQNAAPKASENPLVLQLQSWVRENGEYPTRLVWTNAPAQWSTKKEFNIPLSAPIILGSVDSSADVKFPLTGRGEWAVLQKTKTGLQFRSLIPKLPVEFFGDPSQLRVGDRIKIFDYHLEFAQSAEWVQLKSMLKKFGATDTKLAAAKKRTLAETLRDLMESGLSGELVVKSDSKSGFITIQEGYVEDALAGPVSGLKALFRILSWPDAESRFERYSRVQSFETSLRIGPMEFQKTYDRWKQKVAELKAMWPPHQLKISADPAVFMKKKDWDAKSFMVFSIVCESKRVYEVINQCPLMDVEVVDSLISLRRENLVRIA